MESLFLIFNLPLSVLIGYQLGGIWTLAPLFTLYVVAPILDILVLTFAPQLNGMNFFKNKNHKALNKALQIYPFLHFALLLYIINGTQSISMSDSSFWFTLIGMGVASGGTGLLIGHELMHQNSTFSRVGTFLLTGPANYTHWIIEHLRGHHVNVGLYDDPCTSRKNESIYKFFIRSYTGQIVNAYKIDRIYFIKYKSLELALLITIFSIFSFKAVIFVVLQGLIASFLLEQVNYIEHYGLTRIIKENGMPEKVTPELSWDTNSILANVTLINLGFHANHHSNVGRPFYKLEPTSKTNTDHGIPTQLVQTFIPSLWFSLMNPKLEGKKVEQKVDSISFNQEVKV